MSTSTKRKDHRIPEDVPDTAATIGTGIMSRTILQKNKLAGTAAVQASHGITGSVTATRGLHDAVENCRAKVAKIAKECRRANRKYRDFYFDLRNDGRYCLDGLTAELESKLHPAGVARVEEIFDEPKFFKDGVGTGDIQQGATGDCWFLAAVATITNVAGLIEKICVARDELVGVYGFIFMRDGEWVSTIVDDQLYISTREYHDADRNVKAQFSGKEKEYNQTFAKGSEALLFAKCADKSETWLPLLEKAYAKVHGDYGAIEGGWTGEAVEDLTGGVTSEVYTCDIMDKDRFWKEELRFVNKDFLFAAGLLGNVAAERSGIISGHAYSVLKAREVFEKRFVLIRNPWGCTEWTGPWSDGSKEWTSEWMALLDHRFGDDGAFWMSYEDFLQKFSQIDRTRLFNPSWTVTSRWIQVPVPWAMEYSPTRFEINVAKKGLTVIVLSQLDHRYFRGLEGQYSFNLHFRVQRDDETEYITRSRSNVGMSRSVNAELTLKPGKYVVIFKITGEKSNVKPAKHKVLRQTKKLNRRKFLQIGMSCDQAFAKATTELEDEMVITEAAACARKHEDEDEDADEEDEDDDEEDYWDAVACIGLRVYAQDKELTVDVVHAAEEDALDQDDPAKDAAEVAEEEYESEYPNECECEEDECECETQEG